MGDANASIPTPQPQSGPAAKCLGRLEASVSTLAAAAAGVSSPPGDDPGGAARASEGRGELLDVGQRTSGPPPGVAAADPGLLDA